MFTGPISKPESRKKQKAREKREERKVITHVREQCVDRDGFCRAQGIGMGPCIGCSEWCHFGDHKRFKTRGQEPERRHNTQGSLMMCSGHHYEYDKGRLEINALTERGCDGPLEFQRGDERYAEETAA